MPSPCVCLRPRDVCGGTDQKLSKEVDGVAYEVECSMVSIKEGDVDIGTFFRVCEPLSCLTWDRVLGANPSAEEQEESLEEGAQTVNNVIHSFRLQTTQFDKKSYLTYLKGYMKSIKTKLQEKGASADDIKAFETGAQGFAKKIVSNFKDYEFLIGESMDPDGMYVSPHYPPRSSHTDLHRVVLLNYREDGVTPYVAVWKHGLSEMKV